MIIMLWKISMDSTDNMHKDSPSSFYHSSDTLTTTYSAHYHSISLRNMYSWSLCLAPYNLSIDNYSLNKTYGLYNVEQLHLS